MGDCTLQSLYEGDFYHLCSEGLTDNVLVREEEDFYVARNYLALSSWRVGLSILAFCIMSNHFHILVAAENRQLAVKFMRAFKQVYSTYLFNKYGLNNSLKGVADSISLISDISYFRNCVAYILRNGLAAKLCSRVEDYLWSSYAAYFNPCEDVAECSVSSMGARRRRAILKTAMDVKDCNYTIDKKGNISLKSFVRSDIVEKAFKNSGKYFLYQLGSCNDARMEYELVVKPLVTSNDMELLTAAQTCAMDCYGNKSLSDLTTGQKCTMLKRLFFNNRTTVAQLARVMGLSRLIVKKILST